MLSKMILSKVFTEDASSAGDIAVQPGVIGQDTHKGMPVFTVDSSEEFHSFAKGIKTFHRWLKHTKSEEIRQWANSNPGKDFVVKHSEYFITVKRPKGKKNEN